MTSPFPALVLSFILLSFITFYFTTTNVFAQNWTNYNLDGKFSFKYPSDWFVSGTQNRFESFALVAPPNGTAGVWFTLRDNNPGYIDDDEIY